MDDNMQKPEGQYWYQSKLVKQDKFWAGNDNGSSSHDLNSRDALVDGGIILSADLGEVKCSSV